jgi:hypothetical protein
VEIRQECQVVISNRFFAIVRLELEKVVTATFSELAELICIFPCLETLILGFTEWHMLTTTSPLLRLPQHLHALELDRSRFTQILEWLCSFGQDLALRTVCLLEPNERHFQAIDTFLQVLGPSLKSFRIRPESAFLPSIVICYWLLLTFL